MSPRSIPIRWRPIPGVIIAEQAEAFALGQDLLARLTSGKLYLCVAPGAGIAQGRAANIEVAEFEGPHPAGLAGTHIHFLGGVSIHKVGLDDWLPGRDRHRSPVPRWPPLYPAGESLWAGHR